jgi:hypothetical protein
MNFSARIQTVDRKCCSFQCLKEGQLLAHHADASEVNIHVVKDDPKTDQ